MRKPAVARWVTWRALLPLVLLAACLVVGGTDGAFADDAYLLALTWQPGFCAGHATLAECKTVTPRLVLHGLWPDWDINGDGKRNDADDTCVAGNGRTAIVDIEKAGASAWPKLPPVELTAASRGDLAGVMPGAVAGLDRHEWWKHGTCSGLNPDAYFATAVLLLRQVERGQLAKLLVDKAGADVERNALLDAFAADLGKDASRALTLDCAKSADGSTLVELRIRLRREKVIEGLNPESLAIPERPAKGDCAATVRIPGAQP
jgi:ribonuclease T2